MCANDIRFFRSGIHRHDATTVRPNANTAYIAITALVSLSSVCILPSDQ